VLCRIFGPKGDEVKGEWRKLRNEDLHDLYCSPTIVWVIKSRMRREVHLARMEEGEACKGYLWENLRERDHWGYPGVDGRTILRWIFKKYGVGV
jgi:hypothetical protein